MSENPDYFFEEEFRPPDSEMVDYVLSSSCILDEMSARASMTRDDSQALASASRSLKVMLAMAMSGFALYSTELEHANALSVLSESLYDRLMLTDPSQITDIDILPLTKWREYRKSFIDEINSDGL